MSTKVRPRRALFHRFLDGRSVRTIVDREVAEMQPKASKEHDVMNRVPYLGISVER